MYLGMNRVGAVVGMTAIALAWPLHGHATVSYVVDAANSGVGPITVASGPWLGGQGNIQSYDLMGNVAFGKPVEVSGTISNGAYSIHQADHLTDGLYGNGSSWIGANPEASSWFSVDLEGIFEINSLSIGRDRTGVFYSERDPGTVLVEVSTDKLNFSTLWASPGEIVFWGPKQSLGVHFDPVAARYVRVTLGNGGAAIDEVQIAAVPEPNAYVLTLVGVATFRFLRWRGRFSKHVKPTCIR